MLNKVILIGTCGKDPESRFFPSGDKQVTLSLATSERWKDKNGEKQEKTSWHNLVFNRGLADIVEQYVSKGSKIYIEGKIDYQQWESEGVKKYQTRILVSEMKMLDGKKGGDSQPRQQAQAKPQSQTSNANNAPYEDFSDDIPFASLNNLIKNHII